MQIQFKGTNYELAAEMTDLAEKKILGLKKYFGRNEKPVLAYVDLGKSTQAHQSGEVWYADCSLDMEGKRFYAKAESTTLRTAIDKMIGELGRELRVAKKKKESLFRKGGAHLKNFLRFGR